MARRMWSRDELIDLLSNTTPVDPPDPEVFYKLTLPTGVASDQADNTKIKKDTDVVLTVTVPEGQELVSFKVDDVEKKADLVDSKYTVKMTKDITVEVEFKDESPTEPPANFVRFVSAEARTITPKYTNSGVTLEYSVDRGSTWTTIASGASTTSATEHWFRGQATGTKSLFTSNATTNAWAFSGSSDLEVYGNLNFLLCDTLGDEEAPTSLADYCYSRMFYGCTSLTTAPELPATTLGIYCYAYMFDGCTSLTTAPELPATTLENNCYYSMFRGCTSLTTAPELPATTLATGCYNQMFYGCTSLTTAPELPATTLADFCYNNMFSGCTSFKVSATQTDSYTYAWRIPTSGAGTTASSWNANMLVNTGGTFTSDPTIDTTYYVENKPV